MPINSRAKGATGERELANLLKKYGFETRRGQQFCGANGDADVIGIPHIHIECKRVEKLNLENAMAQSIRDARSGKWDWELPTVMHRKNRCEWLVTMRLTDWIKLYESWMSDKIDNIKDLEERERNERENL